jgi:N-sulfoglucosamine sulfohydrolase
MCFDNMFTSSPACAPTRQQLLTGVYPVRNGAHPNHSRVYEGTKSVAHHLQELGYATALIGKKHYAPEESYPFQFLGGRNGDNGEGADIDLEKAEAFIRQMKAKPYFLMVTSNQPHGPLTRGNASAYPPEKIRLPPGFVDTDITRNHLSKYYAEITYLDSLVGVIMNMVEKSGEANNTIIIFTSEQGAGFPFAKWTLYDAGLKTAFIVRWPAKVIRGSRNNALTQYVDIVPTLIDIAGGSPGKINTGVEDAKGYTGFDGKSFKDVLQGNSNQFRNYVFGVQTTRGIINGSRSYPVRSVRDSHYLFIHNLEPESSFQNVVTRSALFISWMAKDPVKASFYIKRPEFELYDVINDPQQLLNLAADPSLKAVQGKMKEKLEAFMNQQGDKGIATEMDANNRKPKNSDDE